MHQARRDGIGMDCDLSLFDTAISLLTYLATWHLTEGYQPVRTAQSAHPSLVPFQNFQTRDGWIVVACAKEKFWQRLAAAVGRPELPADARYLTASDRLANADELLAVLAPEFLREDTARWIEILTEAGVPCGSINSVGEALLDPQVQDRQLVVETEHASLGTVRQVVSPVRVGPWRSDYDRAPLRNEDETYVLADVLGYSQSQIESLRQSGTVRGAPAKEAR